MIYHSWVRFYILINLALVKKKKKPEKLHAAFSATRVQGGMGKI